MNRFLSNGRSQSAVHISSLKYWISRNIQCSPVQHASESMKKYRQLHRRTQHMMEIHRLGSLISSRRPFSMGFSTLFLPFSLSMTRSNMRTRCMLACTGTLRARRPCQRSRRRRSCSDHGVGIVGDGGQSSTTTTTKTSTNQNCYGKHIYRLLSTYCRTKDLYASIGP